MTDHDDTRHNLRVSLFLLALLVGAILFGRCSVQPAQAQQPRRVFLPMIMRDIIVPSTITTTTIAPTTTTTLGPTSPLHVEPTRNVIHLAQEAEPFRLDFGGYGMQQPMFLFVNGLQNYVPFHVLDAQHGYVMLPRGELLALALLPGNDGSFRTTCYAQQGERTSEYFQLTFEP